MGKTRVKREGMPSFPCSPSSSSSSSSDFEFTVSLSPSSRRSPSKLCPADELFYKGQLLPLHLSPRISMVRTLLLTSSSISSSPSSDSNTTASRDSNGSSSSISSGVSADLMLLVPDCDSPRPSSATEEEARKATSSNKKNNYFASLANRFSSVFLLTRGGSKKDIASFDAVDFKYSNASGRRRRTRTTTTTTTNSSAKQVIKKYVEKVKPLYEKLKNQNQNVVQPPQKKKTTLFSFSIRRETMKRQEDEELRGMYSHSNSFSGNLRFPRRKRSVSSCPSSMRSSPTHSGLLTVGGGGGGSFTTTGRTPILAASASLSSSMSSMEELQSAIQGAIAHCKSTMAQ